MHRLIIKAMLTQIQELLVRTPRLKAKDIALALHLDKHQVNQILHATSELFVQDDTYAWSIRPEVCLNIPIGNGNWIRSGDFERALCRAGSPLVSGARWVVFTLAESSKLLLDALARLLAMSNQLADAGKTVVLDFSQCEGTLSYLDRAGFIRHLDSRVQILPERPEGLKSQVYEGNNEGLVELRKIDIESPNQDIPRQLREAFVSYAGEAYSVPALTVIGELFGNVGEHSGTRLPGLAGLQRYKRSKDRGRIQTVISDSGLGVVGTLEPVLVEKYPKVAKELRREQGHLGIALLKRIFSKGGLTRKRDGGVGMFASGQAAEKHNATITIRQSDFEFRVRWQNGVSNFSESLNLVRLDGTHVCVDFDLTRQP